MKNHFSGLGKLLGVVLLSGSALFSCSLFGRGGLLPSSEDGADYGALGLALDPDGQGYAAKTSPFSLQSVHDTSGLLDLPSTGTQNILVIPVKVSDYASLATARVRSDIYKGFFGAPADTGWESLASFYYKSSFKQLLLKGTVSDWYDCGYSTKEISALAGSYSGTYPDYYEPSWTILEDAVAWYKKTYATGCASFDRNNDGVIDAVWLVYGAPHYTKSNGLSEDFWAYTYYDYHLIGEPLSQNDALPYHYSWASYDFLYEMESSWGYGKVDAHTYIHETGHLLGLDDYYVADEAATNAGPMGKIDMMDGNVIDHDAYSKFALGWVKPYVVSDSCSLVLKPASTTGQCVLLPTGDGWNGSFADEYLLLEYYTPTSINEKDASAPYSNGLQGFTQNGVRIYHVDSRLVAYSLGSQTFGEYSDYLLDSSSTRVAIAHSNTNTYNHVANRSFRLIQELDATMKRNFDEFPTLDRIPPVADNGTLFQNGDSFTFASFALSFPNGTAMNDGTDMPYTVSFSSMSEASITLSITKH